MIEICVLVPAVLAWIGGFCMFIVNWGGKNKLAPQKTCPLPIKIEEAEIVANKYTAGFLRELVRLAEENMKELDDVNRVYERKATLLASFSLAVPGYLLSKLSSFDVSWWAWIIYPSFGLVTLFSVKSMDLASHMARGLHPDVIKGFFNKEPNQQEMKWMLYYMLENYRQGLDINILSTYNKYKYLRYTKFCLVVGASGFLGMAFESANLSMHICHWLACLKLASSGMYVLPLPHYP